MCSELEFFFAFSKTLFDTSEQTGYSICLCVLLNRKQKYHFHPTKNYMLKYIS
jgi:ferredoxin-thioredoxin reductase catalytic subunit